MMSRGCLTDLVVELGKLHLDFVPLEIVILCLLTHGRYQVELASHRVRLLVPNRRETRCHPSAFMPPADSIKFVKSEPFWMGA